MFPSSLRILALRNPRRLVTRSILVDLARDDSLMPVFRLLSQIAAIFHPNRISIAKRGFARWISEDEQQRKTWQRGLCWRPVAQDGCTHRKADQIARDCDKPENGNSYDQPACGHYIRKKQ
ncbi:hypothetical protein RUESEDTHA_03679 [Ruegeria sp. THAF57]|nr:hypothetical protein RUESEDTHA_03679 [Ruegeria sp. THAF57]